MGIPLVSYCVAVPRPLFLLVKFLSKIRDATLFVLSYLIFRLPDGNNNRHRRLPPGREPLPSPSTIKEQLPVTEFTSISCKLQDRMKYQSDDANSKHLCIVCLENIEQSDQIRALGNCIHAFHRECIDRWIDVGRVVCPLCRAQLIPRKYKGIRKLFRLFS